MKITLRTHRLQTEQWCARFGLIELHLGHLKIISPSRKPICWMFSLVALPNCTAPGSENIDFKWLDTARKIPVLKRIMLIILYTGYGQGRSIMIITTNSAYAMRNHVSIAQTTPQISFKRNNDDSSIKH